jgi:hypothetical protein
MRNKNVKKANVDFKIRYNQPRGGISWEKKLQNQWANYHLPLPALELLLQSSQVGKRDRRSTMLEISPWHLSLSLSLSSCSGFRSKWRARFLKTRSGYHQNGARWGEGRRGDHRVHYPSHWFLRLITKIADDVIF